MVGFTYAASGGPADKLRADVSAQGGTAVAIQADSADAQQVAVAVDELVAAFGASIPNFRSARGFPNIG
jgi:3-oxoacyl-[acyl-carrier protein] reductase